MTRPRDSPRKVCPAWGLSEGKSCPRGAAGLSALRNQKWLPGGRSRRVGWAQGASGEDTQRAEDPERQLVGVGQEGSPPGPLPSSTRRPEPHFLRKGAVRTPQVGAEPEPSTQRTAEPFSGESSGLSTRRRAGPPPTGLAPKARCAPPPSPTPGVHSLLKAEASPE